MPIPPDSVATNLGAGTAAMHLDSLAIPDYHDIFNSLGATQPPVPPTPSTVSFDVRWQGTSKLAKLADATNHFTGLFRNSPATITWSASQPATHFAFTSAAPSTTVSGVIGRERNGTFFK